MEALLLLLLRSVVFGLRLLPYRARVLLLTGIVRVFLVAVPRYRRVAFKNLSLVFPDKGPEWQREVLRKHCLVLARAFVDALRIPELTPEWAKTHVEFPKRERCIALMKAQEPQSAPLFVGGHVDSFEIMPACIASSTGCRMDYVIRPLRPPKLDAWWNQLRTAVGNGVIDKKGAMKGILRRLRGGITVGLLFDQNLVRGNAVFVDWFGRPAATTKAVAGAALRAKAPVCVISIATIGWGRYRIDMDEVDCQDLYEDESTEMEEKIKELTQRAVRKFEETVRRNPPGWFWLHRRWKTTPHESIAEDFYK